MLFDTYKHRSAVLYGENYTGQNKGHAGTDFDMSQSIGVGQQHSFGDQKHQFGIALSQTMGSLTTVDGQKNSQRVGFRFIQDRGTVSAGTGGDDFRELGIFHIQQGAYEMNPEVNGSDNHVSRTRTQILPKWFIWYW